MTPDRTKRRTFTCFKSRLYSFYKVAVPRQRRITGTGNSGPLDLDCRIEPHKVKKFDEQGARAVVQKVTYAVGTGTNRLKALNT